jgi:hypothetical protein
LDYLTTHTSLSPIRHGFTPSFVNYKKGCTRLAAASDEVYQLLVHGRWFSLGTPASSTTKTCCHDIAEILLKVASNTKNQSNQSHQILDKHTTCCIVNMFCPKWTSHSIPHLKLHLHCVIARRNPFR